MCDLFASLDDEALPQKVLLFKKKISFLQEPIEDI